MRRSKRRTPNRKWKRQVRLGSGRADARRSFRDRGDSPPSGDRIPGDKPKIHRIKMSDGTSTVGRLVPGGHIDSFKQKFGIGESGKSGGSTTHADVHQRPRPRSRDEGQTRERMGNEAVSRRRRPPHRTRRTIVHQPQGTPREDGVFKKKSRVPGTPLHPEWSRRRGGCSEADHTSPSRSSTSRRRKGKAMMSPPAVAKSLDLRRRRSTTPPAASLPEPARSARRSWPAISARKCKKKRWIKAKSLPFDETKHPRDRGKFSSKCVVPARRTT